jgi:hypothetical protein
MTYSCLITCDKIELSKILEVILMTTKSRCGIICDTAACKEQFGFDCAGCVNIESAPWGECEVKICCEGKKLEHCGECADFPCETLKEYANDPEHGDNGARIEQCREWCGAKV